MMPMGSERPNMDEIRRFAAFQEEIEARSTRVQAAAAHALDRLLRKAESRDGGQARVIAGFLASIYDPEAFPLDPRLMRSVDVPVSDDMLACLDAVRWGRAELHTLLPNGERRILNVCDAWGLQWPKD